MTKEALIAAREALDSAEALLLSMGMQSSDAYQESVNAIAIIDAALAQPEQKPVARVERMGSYAGRPHFGCLLPLDSTLKVGDALYAAPGAAPKEPCIHKDVPSSCYRVRCQLGSKCIDDDMSFRAAPAAQPLSDEQIEAMWERAGHEATAAGMWLWFARAIEAHHGVGKEQQ